MDGAMRSKRRRQTSRVIYVIVLVLASAPSTARGLRTFSTAGRTTTACVEGRDGAVEPPRVQQRQLTPRCHAGSPRNVAISGMTEDEGLTPASRPRSVEDRASRDDKDADVGFDWKAVAKSVFEGDDQRPVILFDGMCNLCHGGVNFALDHDEIGKFRFVSLQSKTGQSLLLQSGKRADDISSIVLVAPDPKSVRGTTAYFKSDAVMRIARKLDGSWIAPAVGNAGPFFPRFLRNVVYDFVADNRYRFGHREDSCRLEDDRFDDRFIPDP